MWKKPKNYDKTNRLRDIKNDFVIYSQRKTQKGRAYNKILESTDYTLVKMHMGEKQYLDLNYTLGELNNTEQIKNNDTLHLVRTPKQ